uniref:Uncharacterized protein n=1 Tax=Arundo donax TaxID=35708 RepID=A0A0A9CHQ7_ARUDO
MASADLSVTQLGMLMVGRMNRRGRGSKREGTT